MDNLVHIGNADISIKEYKGKRVVTFKDIDIVHERPDGTAKRNFNTNKARFVEGEDYFIVSADEIRTSRMFPISDKERDRQIAKAQDTAQKAIETTEHIKEAVKPVFDNWRNEINAKFNRIQRNADCQFNVLRTEMYSELEHRAGCDLSRRIRNRRERMAESGCTKTEISALNKMDIIEDDKKLREIFSKIVAEYEIRYCA